MNCPSYRWSKLRNIIFEALYYTAMWRGMWWWWLPPVFILILVFVGLFLLASALDIAHKGEIVERGEPERVIKNPTHPYTQALIKAIPAPDPDIRWIA